MPDTWTGQTLHAPHHKRSVRIGHLLAKGGEGSVYLIDDLPQEVAKIYHQRPDAERCEKLGLLASLRHPSVRKVTAMPTGALHSGQNLVGFTMPKVSSRHSAHTCYHPTDRKNHSPKATWAWLVAIARNIAAAVDEIHGAGLVIGDVNESGFLVDLSPERQTIVTTIDCDSFQVSHDGRVLRCTVGKPEYTPAELIGRPLSTVVRSVQHDAFGLAVLVYQMLMMARHPFHGIYPSELNDGVSQAIARGWYVFGRTAQQHGVRPPTTALDVALAGPRLTELWERAFVGPPAERPLPRQWIDALDHLRGQLVTCQVNHQHQYPRHVAACPWCAFHARHGIDYFPMHLSSSDDFAYSYPLQDILQLVKATTAWAEQHVRIAIPPSQGAEPPTDRAYIDRAAAQAYTSCVASIDQINLAREAYRQWQLALQAWRTTSAKRISAYRAAIEARKTVIESRISAYHDAHAARSTAYDAAWDSYRDATDRWAAAEKRWHLARLARRDRYRFYHGLAAVSAVCGGVLTLGTGLSYIVTIATIVVVASLELAAYAQRDIPRSATPAAPVPPPYPDPIPEPVFPPYPAEPDMPWPVQRPSILTNDQEPTLHDILSDASIDRVFSHMLETAEQDESTAQNALTQAQRSLADYREAFQQRVRRETTAAENLTNTYLGAQQAYRQEHRAKEAAADHDLYQDYLDSIPVHTIQRYNSSFPRHLITSLESSGIGTAKDILDTLIHRQFKVPGIGPAYTRQLNDWVTQHVAKQYRRDPSKFHSSMAMRQLVQRHAARKATLEHALENAAASLRRIQAEPAATVQGLVATVGAAQRTYDTARHKVIYITNVRKALLQRLREYATAPTGTVFDRQIHISITPAMAQRGCHVLIASDTAVTGIFNLHIPAQTTHGDVLRMVGAGASSTANGQDQRGSMLVTVQIDDAAGAWPWNVDNEPDPVVVMPTRTVEHAPRLPKTPPAQHPRHPYVRTAFYLASLAVIAGAAMPLVIAYRDAQAAYLEASSDLSIPGWLNRRNAARVNQREVLARRDLDYLRAHLRAYGTVINQAPVHAMIAELQAEHDRRVLTEREEQRAQHLRTAWALPDPQALLLFAQANAGTPDAEAALAEYRRRIDAARAVEAERAAAAERRKRELETKAHAEAWAKAAALAEKGRAFGVWSEQSVSLRTAASGTDIVRSLREGAEVAQAADRMAEYAEILADTQRRTIPRLGVFVDNGSVPKRVADIRLLLGEPMQRNATGDMWVYGDYTMTIEGNYMVQVQLLPKRAKP